MLQDFLRTFEICLPFRMKKRFQFSSERAMLDYSTGGEQYFTRISLYTKLKYLYVPYHYSSKNEKKCETYYRTPFWQVEFLTIFLLAKWKKNLKFDNFKHKTTGKFNDYSLCFIHLKIYKTQTIEWFTDI